MADREEIVVIDRTEIGDGYFDQGLRLARRAHELDFHGSGGVDMHDRSDIAAAQTVIREITL